MDLGALRFGNVINGEIHHANQATQSKDPRTMEPLWTVPIGSQEDLDDAVCAAQSAFKNWSKTNIEERQAVLRRMAAALKEQNQFMASIIMKETGKSALLSDFEVDSSVAFLEFNASQSLPEEVVFEDANLKIVATHTPIGVVGAICPWNFPLILSTAKIAASLLMGNCIIVKPSPFTPYSVLKFAEITVGIVPPGVFQALNGGNELGAHMSLHPNIQKITFTGSTSTGKKIMESASKTLKSLTLELGGNDATIILPDVDLDSVVPQVTTGCFFNAGQMCVATKRIYVHEDIFEAFMERFVADVIKFSIDALADAPSVFVPLQNELQYSVVSNIIEDCWLKNYKIATGGGIPRRPGLFLEPTIVDRPPDDSRLVTEEQFGPIIPVLSWKTETEVIQRANSTSTGLGACVWAKNVKDAERIGRNLDVGSLWINSFEKPHPAGYFSGRKESGFGGEWGKQGLLSYCNTQTVHISKF
ncbi:hypothetical protein N7474_007842 [Penicillium riverlandense]|uniref:uncharacterized protein n=1 Tax=Penicillium riverlandense TaxID=1903569 RepID=UPI00254872B6|nr:uncharacterized protein N7474_007842 [Penicillium riverlandense]KAJ5811541.1 hypothetical protein N7474_007842 [Penicillium riverlandense]